MRACGVAALDVSVPEPGAGPDGLKDAAEGTGGGAGALWLPTIDHPLEAGGMGGGKASSLPAVPTGESVGKKQNTKQASVANPGAIGGGRTGEPKVVDGLHGRSAEQWEGLPDPEDLSVILCAGRVHVDCEGAFYREAAWNRSA